MIAVKREKILKN